jgi:L-ascorbate metabolism protein UlaG (beta-lactamase superfamily)
MKSFKWILFVYVISFCSFGYAQVPSLSDSMNLDQIEQALKLYPPGFNEGEHRLNVMESLDKIIDFSVRDDKRDEEKLKQIVSFYRRQVDMALSTLEKTKVTEGVHVFKFYSSSLILKSAEGTVAMDFCQGPVGNDYKFESYSNEGEPEKSDYFKTDFFMTKEQRDRLADLVDVYIITHPHQDHADYSLAKRMAQARKPVIGPEQLKYKWEDLAPKIVVPVYETVQEFGPCEIFSQNGYQYKKAKKLENGDSFGVPTRYLSHDVESVRYLIKIGGIIFLQSAETQADAYEWLEKAAGLGWNIDVLISAGMWQGERSVMKYFKDKQPNYFSLPVHEYEITHGHGGNRLSPLLKGENLVKFNKKKHMPLMWGENFHITKDIVSP